MDLQKVKTTVELDARLLYLAKLKALQERKTLRELLSESLAVHLGTRIPHGSGTPIKIGGHRLGGIRGSLKRTAIYEHI